MVTCPIPIAMQVEMYSQEAADLRAWYVQYAKPRYE